VCHPDETSNASDRKDLGQLRASEAGTGFCKSRSGPLLMSLTKLAEFSSDAERRTGTGGAYAPLSEILPSARAARFVRMTQKGDGAGVANVPNKFNHIRD